jgi:ABC-2 type transport system ATP-binding protein
MRIREALGELRGVGGLFQRKKNSSFKAGGAKLPLGDQNAIEVRGLSKTVGDRVVADAIDLDVRRGEVLCLIGPNGVGKTLLLEMLSGYTPRSAGSIVVLGFDPAQDSEQAQRRISFLSGRTDFQQNLTASDYLRRRAQNLNLTAAESQERIDDVLAATKLGDVADKNVSTLSRGMRQRLAIADVLIRKSEIILLDEPIAGLDPIAADDLLETINQLRRNNVTIVMASHLLDLVQHVCDRIAFMQDGHIINVGTLAELGSEKRNDGYAVVLEAADTDVASAVRGIEGVKKVTREPGSAWKVVADRDVRADAARQIVSKGGSLTRLNDYSQSNLRKIYLRYFAPSPQI